MRSKDLCVELWDKIVSRHRSGEGYQNISAALKVPKNTVASIILKWKKFVTTKTLPRAGPLPNEGEGPWSGRWPRTQWSLWQSSRVPLCRWLSFWKVLPSLQHSTKQAFYGRVARRKPLLSKRHMTARLEFAKGPLKDSQTMRNKILWSDETKIESFGLNAKWHIWRKPGTIPTLKHGARSEDVGSLNSSCWFLHFTMVTTAA